MLSSAPRMTLKTSNGVMSSSRALVPTGATLLHGRQSQQVRSLFFNIFPSYRDPEASRDYKIRRNLLRSRYREMKSISRHLSWEKRAASHGETCERIGRYYTEFMAKRGGMRGSWHIHCGGNRASSSDSKPLSSSKDSGGPWITELHNIRRYLDEHRGTLASMIKPSERSAYSGPSQPGPDFVIDPITNRKVPKHPAPIADVGQTEDGQLWEKRRSRLASLCQDLENMDLEKAPLAFHSHGPPPADELDKYRKVTIDTPTHNEELIHRVTDLPKRKPQGVPREPPQPASQAPKPPTEIHDELEKYKNIDINYPPSMNEELIHRVRDLPEKGNTGSVPQGAEIPHEAPSTKASEEATYEDLDKYRPFMDRGEALDPNSDDIQARSWPSRVRHLEQSIGADVPSKASKRKAKPPPPRNGILNTQGAASWDRLQSASPFKTNLSIKSKPYDPYSKEPTGLEMSWAQECVSDPKADKLYIKHYSADGTVSDPVVAAPPSTESKPSQQPLEALELDPEASRDMHNSCQDMYGSAGYTLEKELRASQVARKEKATTAISDDATLLPSKETDEPTLYKILAYDPTMQKINVAETASVVQDASVPLSPAEVMLRLSNPSKFFPHFGPMQKEGFEIVSGNGDVLVFRKVRNTVEPPSTNINPIDMMGREAVPNLGNFASPTGFVSYDYPIEDEEAAASSSRSFTEATKSGGGSTSQSTGSFSEQDTAPKKMGVAKRTVTGAAWLAGTAYGVGVVSEFVKKGSDTAKNSSKQV